GHLVDQTGNFVQGYNANQSGNILGGGATENIQVDFENALPPQQTSMVNLAGNLDADTSTRQVVMAQNALTDKDGDIADLSTELNDLSQVTADLTAGETIELAFTANDGSAG